MIYSVTKKKSEIFGEITLNGSKSISNRALIIRALSGEDFPIHDLSTAEDTTLMKTLLESKDEILDAGHAGTTYRFLTAYLALQEGTQILTGSSRMKERPIGILVEALNSLGADIEYMGNEGFPPLRIKSPKNLGKANRISIQAHVSSQFVSALLLIAPYLPNGLEISLEGRVVSRPYILMTLRLMYYFGVQYHWQDSDRLIYIPPQKYRAKTFTVEADWSAASYYYSMVAFSEKGKLKLNGLYEDSIQGDAVLVDLMEPFGVVTEFEDEGVILHRTDRLGNFFEKSFLDCPDIAQTLAVLCGGLGIPGIFRDIETLFIKETDRVSALQNELGKVGVSFNRLQSDLQHNEHDHAHSITGKASVLNGRTPQFETYNDHRMAMALTPLAVRLGNIRIENPNVVGKSYPKFWEDLQKIGYQVSQIG